MGRNGETRKRFLRIGPSLRRLAASPDCHACYAARMCIPVDSMLWALVARIRDDGEVVTRGDLMALLGSGCPRARVREILEREGAARPDRPFDAALSALETL